MSNENPLRNNAITPRSLIMTKEECFYCGKADDIHHIYIEHMFGIKHCGYHSIIASRDCKAYLHENKMTDLNDLKNELIGQRFLDVFKDKTFSIIRSNGSVDDGWKLKENHYFDKAFITYNQNEWLFPVTKSEGGNVIYKSFSINKLNETRLIEANKNIYPHNFIEIQRDVIHLLEKGIYKKLWELHRECMINDLPSEVPDEDFINTIEFNGNKVRVVKF